MAERPFRAIRPSIGVAFSVVGRLRRNSPGVKGRQRLPIAGGLSFHSRRIAAFQRRQMA
jgi:hypothetical protein